MTRDTKPDGHHGKNHPPKPTKQRYKGNPDYLNSDMTDYLRGAGRTSTKVWIKSHTPRPDQSVSIIRPQR